ncbi:elongation factor Ts, mitochondrial [Periplaneta americana]|uniref:elongation factor Ts, mitochondrial n=1 Tax=Periplaneta americana TaxID=6978 RepID=UPI0037E8B907
MLCSRLVRYLHSCQPSWSSVNKSLLGKLRKKTGYTFANCRKALELHNNDIEQAEAWLKEQAQALGWSKATKLEGRATAQGLVGVAVDKGTATIVEVNCETDFVARNKTFQTMVDSVANACLRFATGKLGTGNALTKIGLDSERLRTLSGEDGKPLSDHVALLIGNVGENVALRRAYCFQAHEGVLVAGYTHPAPLNTNNKTLYGKYGALVAFRKAAQGTEQETPDKLPIEQLGRLMCQHIIGMNPNKIGVAGEDIPACNSDEEKCMIFQEYLLDPSQTVGQFLADSGVSIVDFARFECGEELDIGTSPEQQRNLDMAVEVGG